MTRKASLWFVSIAISLLLITALLWLVPLPDLATAFNKVQVTLLLVAFLPLTAEALITAYRIQICSSRPVPYSRAVYSNAWYVLWLGILPARLGELAGVGVFKKVLGMSSGSAIASIVVQRIYDLAILCGLLLLFMTQVLFEGQEAMWLAALVLVLLCILLFTLPYWLTISARLLYGIKHHHRFIRTGLRTVLQARHWYRARRHYAGVFRLALVTLTKWLINLVAVLLILRACQIEIDLETLMIIGILIHFLGAIPIQSVGGFGVVEVGLTSLLVSADVPIVDAVAASLLLRAMSLGYTAIFFTLCFLVLRSR